jgi:hypothetical protein
MARGPAFLETKFTRRFVFVTLSVIVAAGIIIASMLLDRWGG